MNVMLEFLNGLIFLFYDLVDSDETTTAVINALIDNVSSDDSLDERERLEAALSYGWLIGRISVDDTEIADEYRQILREIENER